MAFEVAFFEQFSIDSLSECCNDKQIRQYQIKRVQNCQEIDCWMIN